MKTRFVIDALRRIKDALYVIELNAQAMPESAAATAIRAVANPAWVEVDNLLMDFEQNKDKEATETRQ